MHNNFNIDGVLDGMKASTRDNTFGSTPGTDSRCMIVLAVNAANEDTFQFAQAA